MLRFVIKKYSNLASVKMGINNKNNGALMVPVNGDYLISKKSQLPKIKTKQKTVETRSDF